MPDLTLESKVDMSSHLTWVKVATYHTSKTFWTVPLKHLNG